MATIRVPSVPSTSYNPNRAVSGLLKTQIQQLQIGVLQAVDTEGEAAHCIRVLRKLLEDLRPQITPVSHEGAVGRRTVKREIGTGAKRRPRAKAGN